MAINVAIRPQETGLDKLVKGLSVANGILGVVGGVKQLTSGPSDLEKLQVQKLQDETGGVLSPREIDPEKLKQVTADTSGAMARRVRTAAGPNGVETQYFIPQPKLQAPQDPELSGLKKMLLQSQIDKNKQEKVAGKNAAASPGQKAADIAFGKEYTDWNANGGYGAVDKQLNALEDAKAALQQNPDLVGKVKGRLPDILRSNDALALQQQIEGAVQGSLKATLGAQFTEKEGIRIMRNSFDPRLSADENIKKLEATIKDLRTRASEKENASQYFESNGTLTGYKPISRQPQAESVIPKPSNNPQAARIQELLAEKARRAGKK